MERLTIDTEIGVYQIGTFSRKEKIKMGKMTVGEKGTVKIKMDTPDSIYFDAKGPHVPWRITKASGRAANRRIFRPMCQNTATHQTITTASESLQS